MNAETAYLAITLFAAFADGANNDQEREHIRRFADSLGDAVPEMPRLYQDILFKRITLAEATRVLTELEQRQFAYEMAVCVCDADGAQNAAEQRFLTDLKGLLGLASDTASTVIEQQTHELAKAAAIALPSVASLPGATPAPAASAAEVDTAALDRSTLQYAILTGALELLPQSWASVAIIPLQVRLVHKIGQAYGNELDQGHIKEFIATVGVGLTSQYLEQFGRKLLGGLIGKLAGKTAGSLGQTATGVAFSFATTYALGQIAQRYYASGRQMSTQLLRETFNDLLGPAKELQARYLPEIREKARTLDAGKVMDMMRGKVA